MERRRSVFSPLARSSRGVSEDEDDATESIEETRSILSRDGSSSRAPSISSFFQRQRSVTPSSCKFYPRAANLSGNSLATRISEFLYRTDRTTPGKTGRFELKRGGSVGPSARSSGFGSTTSVPGRVSETPKRDEGLPPAPLPIRKYSAVELSEIRKRARSKDLNSLVNDLTSRMKDTEENQADVVSKDRYERLVQELKRAKNNLKQQAFDHNESMMDARKHFEKKIADVQEEVEEQRQVVAQWKRKYHRVNTEMNEFKILLDSHASKNQILESKQTNFVSQLEKLRDELRQTIYNAQVAVKERDELINQKCELEQNYNSVKMDLDMKIQQLKRMSKELQESQNKVSGEEAQALKDEKNQLQQKLRDQEKELEELVEQVHFLKAFRIKLEMLVEDMRKEHKKELAQKDEELENIKSVQQKKWEALDSELETERKERSAVMRAKLELERRVAELEEDVVTCKAECEGKVQRLLKRIRKSQQRSKDVSTTSDECTPEPPQNKSLMRSLKNQLQDAEFDRMAALKAKKNAEAEVEEMMLSMETLVREKKDYEERISDLTKRNAMLESKLEDVEEEISELLQKYQSAVAEVTCKQLQMIEQGAYTSDLEKEQRDLKGKLLELTYKMENMESQIERETNNNILQLKAQCKELELKMELQSSMKIRLESQISKLNEDILRAQDEKDSAVLKERSHQETIRKLTRSLEEAREKISALSSVDFEANARRKELEIRLETAEGDAAMFQTELRIAKRKIADLQSLIKNGASDDFTSSSLSFSNDIDSDEEDYETETLGVTDRGRNILKELKVFTSGPNQAWQRALHTISET